MVYSELEVGDIARFLLRKRLIPRFPLSSYMHIHITYYIHICILSVSP